MYPQQDQDPEQSYDHAIKTVNFSDRNAVFQAILPYVELII